MTAAIAKILSLFLALGAILCRKIEARAYNQYKFADCKSEDADKMIVVEDYHSWYQCQNGHYIKTKCMVQDDSDHYKCLPLERVHNFFGKLMKPEASKIFYLDQTIIDYAVQINCSALAQAYKNWGFNGFLDLDAEYCHEENVTMNKDLTKLCTKSELYVFVVENRKHKRCINGRISGSTTIDKIIPAHSGERTELKTEDIKMKKEEIEKALCEEAKFNESVALDYLHGSISTCQKDKPRLTFACYTEAFNKFMNAKTSVRFNCYVVDTEKVNKEHECTQMQLNALVSYDSYVNYANCAANENGSLTIGCLQLIFHNRDAVSGVYQYCSGIPDESQCRQAVGQVTSNIHSYANCLWQQCASYPKQESCDKVGEKFLEIFAEVKKHCLPVSQKLGIC